MFQPGIVAGLGMDWALLPNVFLRAEWEYAAFGELKGIRPTVNTGRVGVAFRF
jgi:opacity protein-like surface antigen